MLRALWYQNPIETAASLAYAATMVSRTHIQQILLLLTSLALSNTLSAHGGVSLLEDEVCIIKIGFLNAHFTGFQPKSSGTKEFCEDIPKVAESVFVIDYLHDFLKEMPVDFRIIKDVNNFGFFANWDDVQSMGDLSTVTVFYQPPKVERSGVYSVNYAFQNPGIYIGIVTAKSPSDGKVYRAVFPFQVGSTNWGYIPLFILLIVLAQLAYLYLNKKSQ